MLCRNINVSLSIHPHCAGSKRLPRCHIKCHIVETVVCHYHLWLYSIIRIDRTNQCSTSGCWLLDDFLILRGCGLQQISLCVQMVYNKISSYYCCWSMYFSKKSTKLFAKHIKWNLSWSVDAEYWHWWRNNLGTNGFKTRRQTTSGSNS